MWYSSDWKEYELIDAADGQRLERWGKYVFVRPDPQAVWGDKSNNPLWKKADGRYIRSSSGGGQWQFFKTLPESWTITQDEYKFKIKPMNFKHMGLFPEQLVNWQWADKLIREANRPINVLNLFAYRTGSLFVAIFVTGSFCGCSFRPFMVG